MTESTAIFNNFILEHSTSLTSGVTLLTLGGNRIYQVARDTRTHSLFVFSSSSNVEATCSKPDEAHRKMLRQIREKFDPSERPFIPCRYRSVEEYMDSKKSILTENRQGVIKIEENRPLYTLYPLWNFPSDPYFTLLIRIPEFFNFFSRQPEYIECLIGLQDPPKLNHLRIVEERSGQWILEKIGFRGIKTTNMKKLFGEDIGSDIKFENFSYFSHELKFDIEDNFNDKVAPKFFILKTSVIKDYADNYQIKAWIDSNGNFHESNITIGKKEITKIPSYILYSTEKSSIQDGVSNPTLITEGIYTKPQSRIGAVNILFREPVSCKQTNIEAYTDFPVLVQRKLDGNRIVVICTPSETKHSTNNIKYYSKSGGLQTPKFNNRFDKDVREFLELNFLLEDTLPEKSSTAVSSDISFNSSTPIMLDCECYKHGKIHAEIAGLCNAIEAKPGFDELFLYVLSVVNLGKIEKFEERKREHYRAERIVARRETDLIKINESLMARSQEDLYAMMKSSVDSGFEGLVLYPPRDYYTFHLDRLFKIKKIYDGECEVIGFKESETDPGAIGSVQVKSKPYLGIRFAEGSKIPNKNYSAETNECVTFFVTASLEKEFKQGSMTNVRFQSCLGKRFTIICDSFSDSGIPMHSRFKDHFAPENERKDLNTDI